MNFNFPGRLFEIYDKVPLFLNLSLSGILGEILVKIPGIISEFKEFLEFFKAKLKFFLIRDLLFGFE